MKSLFLLALVAGCNERPLGPVGSVSEPLCQFDRGDGRGVLAHVNGAEVQLIHADGSRTTPFVFTHAEARNFFAPVVVTSGERVAASASWVIGDDFTWKSDVVLLNRDGQVRWQGSRSSTGYVQLYLNAQGYLAASVGTEGIVVDPEGRERSLLGMVPVAEPTEDGSVAVRGPANGELPGTVGWVRAGADAMEPLGLALADRYATPIMVAGRLAYLSPGEGGTLFVSERPGDVRTVLLPGVDMVGITDHNDSGWVLVGEWHTPRYLVNMRTLEARPIGTNTPEGFRPFQGAISGPRLDGDGAILMGLRDDYAGALYRSIDGRNWQRLGGTVTNVLDIDPLARGGTYLINATSGRYSFEEWQPAPAGQTPDYPGDVVQVVRPQAGVAQKLQLGANFVELWNLQISSDGRCVAFADSSTALTAFDVERARSFQLIPSGATGVFSWIE